jgi:hypothetical protein
MHATTSRPSRATAWGGIVFAVLYVAGVVMAIAGTPGNDNNDNPTKFAADWSKYYADSGHRTVALIGVYALAIACLAVVVFGLHLRDRLADAGAPTAGRLTFAASIMLATLTFVGALAIAWIPGGIAFGDAPVPKGELAYYGAQLGFAMLLVGGGMCAALMLVATGVGSNRTAALPTWLGWAAIVVGVVVGAIGSFFMPMILLVLWMLIAGIVCLRRPFAAEPVLA